MRGQAVEALARVDADGKVNSRWEQVKLTQLLTVLDTINADTSQADEVRAAASEAAVRARDADATSDGLRRVRQCLEHVDRLRKQAKAGQQAEAVARRDAQQVARIIQAEIGWWELCEPDDFWAHADEDTRHLVETYIAGVRGFADRAAIAPDTEHDSLAADQQGDDVHLPVADQQDGKAADEQRTA